ncbi:MAG: OmpA family protein [Bryobacterales bacterium]|nr:OmpA family protein [Bryobacteraceae bacterium]MDW8131266.1 OmpA family protein [Bryobacterales bacterium]
MKNTFLAALAVLLVATGCATKKYVREQVDPVRQRTEELARKNEEAIKQIGALEEKTSLGISRAEERAMGAENIARQAGTTAEQARQSAERAGQMAEGARSLAEQNRAQLGEISAYLENAGEFRLLGQETVLFGFDRADLNPEARARLDALVARLAGQKLYVIEVAGYADPAGPQDYNVVLSRKRAEAVVRYLVERRIPLRRIHVAGLGESEAAGGAEARKQARRVEVRVFVPEAAFPAAKSRSETAENRLN